MIPHYSVHPRGKKRGVGKANARRSNFGSREDLLSDNPTPSSAARTKLQQENNFNTRTRQSKAQAMLARMQDKPPGTML